MKVVGVCEFGRMEERARERESDSERMYVLI